MTDPRRRRRARRHGGAERRAPAPAPARPRDRRRLPQARPGQRAGARAADHPTRRLERWYRVPYFDFRGLRGVATVHGRCLVDLSARRVGVSTPDGPVELSYDVLVVATGVSNGFWRSPDLQTEAEVSAELAATRDRLAAARSVAVVGGGAAAVSAASTSRWRSRRPRWGCGSPGSGSCRLITGRTARHVVAGWSERGVTLHPATGRCCRVSPWLTGPVRWTTGQADTPAERCCTPWAGCEPHTDWLPGSSARRGRLRPGGPGPAGAGVAGVFAVGDVAATACCAPRLATSTTRSGAQRRRLAVGARAAPDHDPGRRRWGSVLGPQRDGLLVFGPTGRRFRFPGGRWTACCSA